jgi:hypothetical protein
MSRLRIGILTDRLDGFQNWELKLIHAIAKDDRFELSAVVIVGEDGTTALPTPLFSILSAVEGRLFAKQAAYPSDAAMSSLARARRVDLRGALDISAGDSALAEEALDVVIRLSKARIPQQMLRQIAFGEWSLSFVDQRSATADWSVFKETSNRAPLTEAHVILRASGSPQPITIATGSYNTKLSAARNAAFVKEKSVILMMRELRRIADRRKLPADAAAAQPAPGPPNLIKTSRYFGHLGASLARRSLTRAASLAGARTGSWAIRIGNGTLGSFVPEATVELPLAKGMWAADPFLFHHENGEYLFFECYPNSRSKAWISVARLVGNRAVLLGDALRLDYHLSFPFVFRRDQQIFMIPETHQANRVEVWRCVAFPLKWELYATALEGSSPVDTVMFEHQGSWWMLTTLSDHHAFEEHCSELYAYSIDGPELRSVVPHKRNPVVIGSATARNAGRVMSERGRLLRPSQLNANGVYGYGLNIMEIKRLDLDDYVEIPFRTILPDFDRGLIGCHHIDASAGRVVIDVCKA